MKWLLFVAFLVIAASGKPKDYYTDVADLCEMIKCVGEGYECINGQCYCAHGYMPNPFQNRCMKCPGFSEKCFGPCCSYGNGTLTCWQGVCQYCYDSLGNWICRESLDHILLISSTQIAMATALVLGIIATFMLLYKLCAATAIRPIGASRPTTPYEARLSIGSLQLHVEERLRDAPPRYTRAAPSGTSIIPATVYVNSGFIHDCTVPPPPYSPPKDEQIIQQPTIHM